MRLQTLINCVKANSFFVINFSPAQKAQKAQKAKNETKANRSTKWNENQNELQHFDTKLIDFIFIHKH